jgi:murein DD-endopeptidase MepM/ murein hydrolase activator NlpD
VPATGTRAADAHARSLRLLGSAVALVFLVSAGAAWPAPVEARDWTPQIQTTRRAQIYWETMMRGADAQLRSLKRSRKQAQLKLRRIEANLDRAVDKRVTAKHRLNEARSARDEARARLAAAKEPTALPLRPDVALETLVTAPQLSATDPATAVATLVPGLAGSDIASVLGSGPVVTGARDVASIQQSVKKSRQSFNKAKRGFKQARRKARRSARNVRAVRSHLVSLKSVERSAVARREGAERNLGSWILAMTKYGRIRATKKSDVRPGVNSRFAWPVRGRITQYYSATHDGLDIARYRGAPVRAAAFGVVTYVGWNPWDEHARAFMVVVTHAGGYETLYGHLLPNRVVRVGEEVTKGHVIGYMGSTGNSTGPHLHLELRRGRTTLNPLSFL